MDLTLFISTVFTLTLVMDPLGNIPLDRATCERLAMLPQVQRLDQAHAMEHSLEVQLPFLQYQLKKPFKMASPG